MSPEKSSDNVVYTVADLAAAIGTSAPTIFPALALLSLHPAYRRINGSPLYDRQQLEQVRAKCREMGIKPQGRSR